jgi:hypothetical protein
MALTAVIGNIPCEVTALTDRGEEPNKNTEPFELRHSIIVHS